MFWDKFGHGVVFAAVCAVLTAMKDHVDIGVVATVAYVGAIASVVVDSDGIRNEKFNSKLVMRHCMIKNERQTSSTTQLHNNIYLLIQNFLLPLYASKFGLRC